MIVLLNIRSRVYYKFGLESIISLSLFCVEHSGSEDLLQNVGKVLRVHAQEGFSRRKLFHQSAKKYIKALSHKHVLDHRDNHLHTVNNQILSY